MKKRKKKAAWVVAPPVLALTLIAGSSGMGQGTVLAAPEETTEEDPQRGCTERLDIIYEDLRPYYGFVDLHGTDVRIVQWWDDEFEDLSEPKNQFEEDLRDYRDMIQETFKFTIHTDNIGLQGETYVEKLSSSITAGEPIGQICALDASWVPAFLNNNLMAPLDLLLKERKEGSSYFSYWGLNFKEDKWNTGVKAATSVGGHVYGMALDHKPGYGIFFNKRLLREAGYDEDALYDLQKNGTWTWSKFEEVLKICTRETDGDGVTDVWGMAGNCADYFTTALYSAGVDPVTKAPNGRFINRIDSDEVLEVLSWANETWNKYALSRNNSADDEYARDQFNNGKVALWIGEESAKPKTEDDLGFVLFPCPDGKELIAVERQVVMFIPSSYDEETALNFAIAYDLYTDPTPGYEDGDVWKEYYYSRYADARAVDETLQTMMRGKNIKPRLDLYVEGLGLAFEDGLIRKLADGAYTPSEAIEEQKPIWDDLIAKQNAALDKFYEDVASAEVPTEAPTEAPTEEPTEALTEAPTEAGSKENRDETTVAPTEAASDTKGNNTWPFVICGAVILLGAVAGVILKRKRSRKD